MKTLTGKVVIKRTQETAIVEVGRFFAHPLYGKRLRRTKRYQVHDETGVAVGDIVNFKEVRPMSKTKRWKIVGGKEAKV